MQLKRAHLIFCGLLFSLILNAPFLIEYARWGETSILSFNDIDEPNYLRLPFAMEAGLPLESYYAEHRGQVSLINALRGHPNRICDLLVGFVATRLSLGPIELGLLLDLGCGWIGFVLAFAIAKKFMSSDRGAIGAATIGIAFPWVFWIGQYFNFEWGPGSHFASSAPSPLSVHFYPRLPIFRAIYTQLSVLLFLFVIVRSLAVVQSKAIRPAGAFALGILCGSAIYLYFFSWVACFTIAGLFLWLGSASALISQRIKTLATFVAGILICSFPGLWILSSKIAATTGHFELLKNYWFLPLEYAPLIVILGIAGTFSSSNSHQRLILFVLGAIPAIDVLFSNLQPLFGMWLEPHHLGKYFLWPLFSLFGTCLLLSALEKHKRKILIAVSGLIFAALCMMSAMYSSLLLADSPQRLQFAELLTFLKQKHQRDAVIATYPFLANHASGQVPTLSNVPNIISALSGNPILLQYTNSWLSNVSRKERGARELLTATAYNIPIEALRPCPPQGEPLPGDLFSFTSSLRYVAQLDECRVSAVPSTTSDLCNALKEYRVDYVLEMNPAARTPAHELDQERLIWRSSDGQMALRSFPPMPCPKDENFQPGSPSLAH